MPPCTPTRRATDLRFEGNVEGKDLTKHLADVVVCDAVLGNVVIKFFEGLSTFIFDLWRDEFRGSLRGRLADLLMRPGIGRIRDVFDYERSVGRRCSGSGTVIITHGRAKRRMIGVRLRGRGDDGPDPGAGPDRRGAGGAIGPPRRGGRHARRSRSQMRWPARTPAAAHDREAS